MTSPESASLFAATKSVATHQSRWDEKASIRSRPRRMAGVEATPPLLNFSPDCLSTSRHPSVANAPVPALHQLLTLQLYAYLAFTVQLEHTLVNQVLHRLALGHYPLSLPPSLVLDAHRFYCDEGYHGLAAADLQMQIERISMISPIPLPTPSFLRFLRKTKAMVPVELRSLGELCFTVVSETLISGTLRHLPRDPRVAPAVRSVVADHAHDEAYHRSYFAMLMELAWPPLPPSSRQVLGPLLAECIVAFLRPDREWDTRNLLESGWSTPDVNTIISDTYHSSSLVPLSVARFTVDLFRRVGVLDDPATYDAFWRLGLTDP